MKVQDVPPTQLFWLQGGKTIKNIVELNRELRHMSNETFTHHVNERKNDFANWIEACVKDTKLAALVRTTRNKERMAAIIERKIQESAPVKNNSPPQEPSIIRTKNVTLLTFASMPNIIKTKNVTKLTLTHHKKIIKSGKTTPLNVTEPSTKITRIETPHKTQLTLGHHHTQKEIYVHEIKKQHHSLSLLVSHVVLGLVVGVAITIIVIAFST